MMMEISVPWLLKKKKKFSVRGLFHPAALPDQYQQPSSTKLRTEKPFSVFK